MASFPFTEGAWCQTVEFVKRKKFQFTTKLANLHTMDQDRARHEPLNMDLIKICFVTGPFLRIL